MRLIDGYDKASDSKVVMACGTVGADDLNELRGGLRRSLFNAPFSLVVDLTAANTPDEVTEFAVLAVVVAAACRAHSVGGSVRLVTSKQGIIDIVERARLGDQVQIHRTLGDALRPNSEADVVSITDPKAIETEVVLPAQPRTRNVV